MLGVTIDHIRDGDTFCAGDLCIRPRCIDTPEVGEEGFHEATDDATELVMGVTVTLTGPFRKSWDRVIADVWLPDGRTFSEAMKAKGWAGYDDGLCD